MILILHFTIGFISSFLGSLMPSMLNMTAAKISLNKGKNEAVKFAIGVSVIVLIQAYIATLFTRYLSANPHFEQYLQRIALVIFAVLSFYFYKQYKKDQIKKDRPNKGHKNTFVVGLLLSSLNMFSIPFYCGITTALDVAGWLQFSQTYIITFVIGSALGTFSLLFMYLKHAKIIQTKSKALAKNLNIVLSVLTGILAVVTLIKIL